MTNVLGIEVRPAESSGAALASAEIALVATNAAEPAAPTQAFTDVAHLGTVGHKFNGYHELPVEVVEAAAVVASDSPQQILAQGKGHLLHGSTTWLEIEHLGNVSDAGGRSVFLSAGLAGTEVLVADHLLSKR